MGRVLAVKLLLLIVVSVDNAKFGNKQAPTNGRNAPVNRFLRKFDGLLQLLRRGGRPKSVQMLAGESRVSMKNVELMVKVQNTSF